MPSGAQYLVSTFTTAVSPTTSKEAIGSLQQMIKAKTTPGANIVFVHVPGVDMFVKGV